MTLSESQKNGLEILNEPRNIFLTGAAGSGKTFLLNQFLKNKDPKKIPVLASTGVAAVLINGRTFHSFFGLGIMEGGPHATIQRAIENKKIVKRLNSITGFVVDEISMLSGETLRVAEAIARKARDDDTAWGGLKMIAVGDFSQLPPVNPYKKEKEWAFLDSIWEKTNFKSALLTEIMRTHDSHFIRVLNFIREGIVNEDVWNFMDSKVVGLCDDFDGAKLFGKRDDVDKYNFEQLQKINEPLKLFKTEYRGCEKAIEQFKRISPIQDELHLKKTALVMLRKNDVIGMRWVNGSLGHVTNFGIDYLGITLLNGKEIEIEKEKFTLLDSDGKPQATATNFPVTLAYAITIHKAQGATLDRVSLNLQRFWEPGQAYVALSRVKSGDGLFLENWSPKAIFADPIVKKFHEMLATSVIY